MLRKNCCISLLFYLAIVRGRVVIKRQVSAQFESLSRVVCQRFPTHHICKQNEPIDVPDWIQNQCDSMPHAQFCHSFNANINIGSNPTQHESLISNGDSITDCDTSKPTFINECLKAHIGPSGNKLESCVSYARDCDIIVYDILKKQTTELSQSLSVTSTVLNSTSTEGLISTGITEAADTITTPLVNALDNSEQTADTPHTGSTTIDLHFLAAFSTTTAKIDASVPITDVEFLEQFRSSLGPTETLTTTTTANPTLSATTISMEDEELQAMCQEFKNDFQNNCMHKPVEHEFTLFCPDYANICHVPFDDALIGAESSQTKNYCETNKTRYDGNCLVLEIVNGSAGFCQDYAKRCLSIDASDAKSDEAKDPFS